MIAIVEMVASGTQRGSCAAIPQPFVFRPMWLVPWGGEACAFSLATITAQATGRPSHPSCFACFVYCTHVF